MKILDFIEKIIGHIAWLIVVIIVFLFFRKELLSILKRVKSAKVKDVEVVLGEKVEEVRNEAQEMGVTVFYPIETLRQEFNIQNSDDSARAVYAIESWEKIENLIFSLDDRNSSHKNLRDSLDYLVREHKVNQRLKNIILELKDLRNMVVHDEEVNISPEEYNNWMSISKSVIDRLKSNS